MSAGRARGAVAGDVSNSQQDVSSRDRPLKDHGSLGHTQCSEDDIAGHHREKWQDQAMYIGLRYPKDRKKRRHHKHGHKDSIDQGPRDVEPARPLAALLEDESDRTRATPPSQRVQFLLGRDEGVDDDEEHATHEMFCEMAELRDVGEDGDKEWKETARWIKFEEDVEEGGERWSKPHVATLSLHSLFELRKCIMTGIVMLDTDATSIAQVTDLVLDQMIASNQLEAEVRESVHEVLLSRHRHQHQRKESKGLPVIRSMADIGRRASERKIEFSKESAMKVNQSSTVLGSRQSSKDLHGDLTGNNSSGDMVDITHKYNEHFLKKIPSGAEASNILVGEVANLANPIMAFVRLSKASILADLTEVPVPTRFIFILLGPAGHQQKYHEIGRSIATLMTDEIFHDVAYKSRDRTDLLSGIDEFLDCVTVLPPGEWDPTIRIEPPKSVPSQEKRKKPEIQKVQSVNGMAVIVEEPPKEEPEQHSDPTLMRTGRVFGGLISDIKRKAPWYLSDFKDALHVQCIASFFFMYFACLTPIITFGGLLGAATGDNIAAMESLVSGAICGISYHLFAGQPLTIIGSTGPVLVFESIVYSFCKDHSLDYMCFRFWIGMWMCVSLLIIVAFDLSALVRYITRFTEESFAMLIAVIFVFEAFKKLTHILDHSPVDLHPDPRVPIDRNCTCNFTKAGNGVFASNMSTTVGYFDDITTVDYNSSTFDSGEEILWTAHECEKHGGVPVGTGCNPPVPDVFFFSCLLFIGTFLLAMSLKMFRNTRFFPNQVRIMISDFAVFSSILIMVLVDFLVNLETPKLQVPLQFVPTKPGRGWITNPFKNEWYWVFAAFPPSLLATILIFMDQQITAVIVNRKENLLRKGSGYHLDMLVVTLQIGICSLIGTPWFVAATVLSINHIRSLTRESESSAPGERPKFLGVREQRVTGTLVFVLVGLSALMANVLKYIPMPVLYGVFLYMGISSLKGIQFVQRVMIIFMPTKYQPDYMFIRNVPTRRIHLFTFIQMCCFAGLWIIKQVKAISIVFPLMVLAMCFIRKGLDWVFTRHELKWLDDIMPESHKREKADKKKKLCDVDPDEPQIIAMEGGTVMIPLTGGKALHIPANNVVYDPARHQLNISEEMSKTGIWKQLNSESKFPTPPPSFADVNGKDSNQMRQRKTKLVDVGSNDKHATDVPVKFQIEDDDEDDAVSEKDHLACGYVSIPVNKSNNQRQTISNTKL